jgi:hypothetical protein
MSFRINKRKNPYPMKNAGIKRPMVSYRKPSINSLVARAINAQAETKENPVGASLGIVPTGGTAIVLNNIAEGTDFNTRVGRTISPKNIQIDFSINPPNTVPNTDTGFVALVYDSQPNATAAAFYDIFLYGGSVTPGQAFKNTAAGYEKRFKICWIEHYAVGAGGDPVKMRKFWKCREGKTEFNTSSGAVAITGAYYICVGSVSNSGTGSTSAYWTYNSKFTFTDL